MRPLTAEEIRGSFVNSSRSRVKAMTLPTGFPDLPWDDLDFLGWRDPKAPARGYLVVPQEKDTIGLEISTAASGKPRKGSGLCDICYTAQPITDIALFVARKAGAKGKNGDTVGTYICADLACSLYLRGLRELELPQGETLPVSERVARLGRRLDAFIDRVSAG